MNFIENPEQYDLTNEQFIRWAGEVSRQEYKDDPFRLAHNTRLMKR